MELRALIDALTSPAAYPELRPARVEVIQTHVSAVFLLEHDVFKVKKPVDLGFLDYSTLARRRAMCEAEVELNRRLAPEVYLGVVPVTCHEGQVVVGGAGEVIDYAVHMRRLPDERTLEAALSRGEVPLGTMEALGGRLAAFHAGAARGPAIAAFARFAAVERNCLDNFPPLRRDGAPVSAALVDRVEAATRAELGRERGTIEGRAERGVPCDSHGDLRVDHVYLFPERAPPDDLLVIDCIEFNDGFRYGDPVADLAFLVMDLRLHGHEAHAAALCAGYFAAAEDAEGRGLLPLYTAYRATVRAKVECFRHAEPEVPASSRAAAAVSAPRHLLLALAELSPAGERPALVLVAGLPACGKSTLARGLSAVAGFSVIRTDVVRKELAGLEPLDRASAPPGAGIYSAEMTARTYETCLERAEARLLAGERVIVDANFRSDAQRHPFFALAGRLGVPARLLVCEVAEAVAIERLVLRTGDASDADTAIYHYARAEWEAPGESVRPWTTVIDATEAPAVTLGRALEVLEGAGIVGAGRPATARV